MVTTARLAMAFAVTALALTSCGIAPHRSANGIPSRTDVVVHTGPGGGSDVFARQVVKLLQQTKLMNTNWSVRNQTEGSGIGAMSYLRGRRGRDDSIAAITPTWLVTPLTLKNSAVSISDVQPVAGLLVEPQLMAVRADSPYRTAADFIDAARDQPDRLVQVGGSITATDSLSGKAMQAQTGANWSYLSFSDSGQRIASLLRGDAQMMIGASNDFVEQVRAGKIRVIAAAGDRRVPTFPQIATLREQGLPITGLPEEFRGFVGPPGIPPAALAHYQDLFKKLVTTPEWTAYAEENGDVTEYQDAARFGAFLDAQRGSLTTLVRQLKLGPQ
ncbi:Bug family tripartite tricarboxylate transporter substrate binding protein [Pseudonocardia spinosispora]|uniref:Bug family tripartite tricarboxylate transporter substrate binding protein n=1 Tax=Pseudonocardia spinosispora TaxID=103441 RepID=UPI00041BC7FA|nr:tripartite tricarboxylate transporter substrate binding protein [Pseudonocardia spinosispora]